MEKEFVEPDLRSLKKKWVEALRSGRFQQTRNYWSDKPGEGATAFCCVGVAGHICNLGYAKYIDVRHEYGMSFDVQDLLFDMNDKQRKSFAEIADWVETHDLKTGELLLQAERSDAAPTPLSE